MIIVGIVAEYNPLHLGHKLHIEETRSLLGKDTAVVCVMSGNYTQRGDFAVFEKHARAKAALLCGADLVLELPTAWALSSAENFAFGAVSILNNMGNISHLSFGSEAGEIAPLSEVADMLLSDGIDEIIREELKAGVSYAAARNNAAEIKLGKKAELLKSPNNILGVEYIKAIKRIGSEITPVTFRRIGAGHDSAELNETASASKVREMLENGGDAWKYIPEEVMKVFTDEINLGRGPVFTVNSETAILSKLRQMRGEEFSLFDCGAEGLGERLCKNVKEATLSSVMEKTKTKRYALSRIRRLVLRIYLGLENDMPENPPYAKVLAIGERGREILKKASKDFPIIVKPAAGKRLESDAKRIFDLEATATDLYVLAYPNPEKRGGGQEYTIGPIIL